MKKWKYFKWSNAETFDIYFFASGASAIISKMNFKIPTQKIAQQQAFACLDMESERILKT